MKKAFTMVELVFVIVILGILAAVAIPRMGDTSNIAMMVTGTADVATIRSAIVSERQSRLILGDDTWITTLSNNVLFDGNGSSGLLMYGIQAGDWTAQAAATVGFTESYNYTVDGVATTFDYNVADGTFTCGNDGEVDNCAELTN